MTTNDDGDSSEWCDVCRVARTFGLELAEVKRLCERSDVAWRLDADRVLLIHVGTVRQALARQGKGWHSEGMSESVRFKINE